MKVVLGSCHVVVRLMAGRKHLQNASLLEKPLHPATSKQGCILESKSQDLLSLYRHLDLAASDLSWTISEGPLTKVG